MYERSFGSLSICRFALPVALIGASLVANSASAQRREAATSKQVRLTDVTKMTSREPDIRAHVSSNFDARNVRSTNEDRDWLILRAVYETAPEWTDDVTVTFYALFKTDSNEDPSKRYLLFRGETSYFNLDRGHHNAFMFIHPDTLDRYGDVERIAVQLTHKGQDAGSLSDPKSQEKWWTQLQPVPGQLLPRTQTPFDMVNRGFYDMVKPGSSQRR